MSPKTLLIAAAALAASAAAIPASAAPGPNDPGNHPVPLRAQIMFNLIDTNGDGAIDATEAAALQKAIFGALDANKDGKLTEDEFRKVAAGFDGDGQRRPGMMMRGGPGMGGPGMGWPGFHRPGDHRQGQLDDQQGPDGQGGPNGPQLGDNQDGQPPQGAPPPRDFASLDTNGDGVVSPDEFAAGAPPIPGAPQPQ